MNNEWAPGTRAHSLFYAFIRFTYMRSSILILSIALTVLLPGCTQQKKSTTPNWQAGQQYYLKCITLAIEQLEQLKSIGGQHADSKRVFENLRNEFKKAEPYASYLNPDVGHMANGPALPIFKEDNLRVLLPVGLQKIEEGVYESEYDSARFRYEIGVTIGLLNNLKNGIATKELTAQRFFVATHQQLLRIISLGISGFDTPVSGLGISEAATSLRSLVEVYQLTIGDLIQSKNDSLDKVFRSNVQKAVDFIEANKDFKTFDRYTFVSRHMSAITRNWVYIRKASGLWEGSRDFPFNVDAPTFFESNSFNVAFFTPNVNKNPSDKQIALGKMLFFEKRLSENGTLACASCHIPGKAYADGLVKSKDNEGNLLQRNTPTIINSVFQRKFFWDGRADNLLDQIAVVFVNEKEFASNAHRLSPEILQDKVYQGLLKEAFGESPKSNLDVIKAISSYVSTLNSFSSKFDRNMRGEEFSFTPEEIKGMNLFMGKALCGTCHFIPLTNGTVPPFFNEMETEIIGVPATAENKALDDDLGIYWKYNAEIQKGRFKTPTIRNAALTAPYMHNGVYQTLEEVMDFYNKGGGAGLGFDQPYQTLPFDALDLSEDEIKAIVAFTKTLTDTNVEE
jgi:cytochrome c peroxidase